MPTLSLNGTLKSGFSGILQKDPQKFGSALRRYQTEIAALDDADQLNLENLRACPQVTEEACTALARAADSIMSSVTYTPGDGNNPLKLFQNGTTVVAADSNGGLLSLVAKPLEDPNNTDHAEVMSYGNHLRWALSNIGLSVISFSQTGTDIDDHLGYNVAAVAKLNLDGGKSYRDVEFLKRPHLGSAFTVVEGNPIFASTSGMLLTPEVREHLLSLAPEDDPIASAIRPTMARIPRIDAVIGALETMFSRAALNVVYGNTSTDEAIGTWFLDPIVAQIKKGINVH